MSMERRARIDHAPFIRAILARQREWRAIEDSDIRLFALGESRPALSAGFFGLGYEMTPGEFQRNLEDAGCRGEPCQEMCNLYAAWRRGEWNTVPDVILFKPRSHQEN